jgi:uncharacterized membrane protein
MDGQLFRVGEILSQAWKFTKEHLGFLLGYLVLSFLINGLFSAANHKSDSFLIKLLGTIVGTFLCMGLYNSALLIVKGVKPGFEQLYSNWPHFVSWFLSSLLFGLMVFMGLILFIVPGLYLVARYGLYPFFILDKGLGSIDALKGAERASAGRRWELFLLFMSCFGLNLLGFLLLGIGVLFTIPLTVIALAVAYRRLTAGDVTLITEP